jgi:hypothetical protein
MDGGLCFFHANPNKAAELGRIGGSQNRHSFTGLADPARDLKTAKGVLEECARLIENIYTGKIPPKVATCIGPLLSLQMRVIQVAELEARIAKLEQAQGCRGQHANDGADKSSSEGECEQRNEPGIG